MILKNKKIKIKLGFFLIFFFTFNPWVPSSFANSSQSLEKRHDEEILNYNLLIEQFWNFKGPISLTKMLSRDLNLLGKDLDKKESLFRNSEDVAQLQKIYRSYHNSRNVKKIPSQIFHVNEFRLNSLVDIGLTNGNRKASELLIRSARVNTNLGKLLNFLEKELQNSFQVFLKYKLNQYKLETGDQNFDNFKDKPYVEIFEQLKRFKVPKYEEKARESLSEKGKRIAGEFLFQELENVIFNQKLDQFSNDKVQLIFIEQHVNKTIVFLNTMSILQEHVLRFIKGVNENQKIILDQVRRLSSTNDEVIKRIPIKVSNIQSILEERLESINSSPELKVLKIHFANKKNIQLFNDMTKNMRNVAKALNDVKSSFPEIQFPDKISSATNNLVLLATDNLIQNQMVRTNRYRDEITFGVTIISGFVRIFDSMFGYEKREILEAIEKVIEVQKELYTALSDNKPNERRNEYHIETQQKSDRIMIDRIGTKVASCYDLLTELEQIKRKNSMPASSSPYLLISSLKYSDYKKIFNNFSESLARCEEGLYDVTAPNVLDFSIGATFSLKNSNIKLFPNSFAYYDENNQDFLNKIYMPALLLLKKHIHLLLNKPKSEFIEQEILLALESFSEISFSETDLETKLSHLSQSERNQTPEIFYQLEEFLFLKDYIVPQVTINVARYIMNLYPFFDIRLNRKGLLPDYNVLISNRSVNQSISKQSLVLLKRLRQIVRLSMIQENIISGDFMLPIYYKILMDPNHIDYEKVKRIIKASGLDSILVRNLTHYAIFKSFNKEDETYEYDENNMILINRPLKTYQEAFENEDLLGFQTLFNHQYDVKHLDDKSLDSFWNYFAFPLTSKNLTFSLSNVPFLMPSPNQIASQTFRKSRYYQTLSDLSQYIDECILDYKFKESLSAEEVQTLNQSMLELKL